MIMRPGRQELLLPAQPWFIATSLLLSLLLNMVIHQWLGRSGWVPDWLALALLFWGVHQPRRVGVGWAFVLGLLLDVHQGALLGQHALAYSLLGYLAISMHRRVLWFGLLSQGLHLLPVLLLVHAVQWLVRLLAGDGWPVWSWWLAPPLEAALWPLVSLLLLAPQRRAPDQDLNRPL